MTRIGFILIIEFFLCSFAFGQQVLTGTVTDANSGRPVGQVNVLAVTANSGTSTDDEGKFTLKIDKYPVTIQFSHIAYEPKYLTLTEMPLQPLQVRMTPRLEPIGEVIVEGGKYVQVMRRENFYVTDFEFDQDKIWVLGYAGKSILNPQLVLLNQAGSILARESARGQNSFFKDAFERIHMVGKESMTRVSYSDGRITLGESRQFGGWEQNLFDLQLVLGHTGIFRWEYNNGLLIEFAAVDFRDTTATIIHKSYDRNLFEGETNARLFRHRTIPTIVMSPFGPSSRTEASWDPSDAFTRRAQEQVTYRPMTARIFRYRNNYFIFEDRACHLWKYDIGFLNPADLIIPVPPKAENTDMLQDPLTGSLYLHFTFSGTDYISGIDPDNGTILFTRKLNEYHSIEKLKIYDNRIWFTHQNLSGSTMMNLYSTEIREF